MSSFSAMSPRQTSDKQPTLLEENARLRARIYELETRPGNYNITQAFSSSSLLDFSYQNYQDSPEVHSNRSTTKSPTITTATPHNNAFLDLPALPNTRSITQPLIKPKPIKNGVSSRDYNFAPPPTTTPSFMLRAQSVPSMGTELVENIFGVRSPSPISAFPFPSPETTPRDNDIVRQVSAITMEDFNEYREGDRTVNNSLNSPFFEYADPYSTSQHGLSTTEINRYSRNLLVTQFGLQGQKCLLAASVLIIGAGSVGSYVATELTNAGVGKIGIIDNRNIIASDFNRNIMFRPTQVGASKAETAQAACQELNNNIQVVAYNQKFDTSNASELLSDYDIVVDTTNNVATHYVASDAAVVLGRPLVMASTSGLNGECTVYNATVCDSEASCYRCIYPDVAANKNVTSLDAGAMGSVVGIVGSMASHQVIGLATTYKSKEQAADKQNSARSSVDSSRSTEDAAAAPFQFQVLSNRVFKFDGLTCETKTVITNRAALCSCANKDDLSAAIATKQYYANILDNSKVQVNSSIQPVAQDDIYTNRKTTKVVSMNVAEYAENVKTEKFNNSHLLIDVRDENEYKICALPNSVNIPLKQIKEYGSDILPILHQLYMDKISGDNQAGDFHVLFLDRKGADALAASKIVQGFLDGLESSGKNEAENRPAMADIHKNLKQFKVANINGGLSEWTSSVDANFPLY